MPTSKAYDLALSYYNEYTQKWIEARNNNNEQEAKFYKDMKYKLLDIVNLLDPEKEEEKIAGFLL